MGSMFRLTYNVTLRDATKEKEMIDRIRERNGNLEIMVSKQENRTAELWYKGECYENKDIGTFIVPRFAFYGMQQGR